MSNPLPSLTAQAADQLLNGCAVCLRPSWSVLKASGPTIREYLQGQITQDIKKLTPATAIHSALLTPQGKAVSELYIVQGEGDELLLLTPATKAEATVARLRRFALGHQLRIGIVESLAICSLQGAHAHAPLPTFGLTEPDGGWLACSRNSSPESYAIVMPEQPRGYWVISNRAMISTFLSQQPEVEESAFEAMRIIRGFPDFGIEWDESMHPLNANLIEFDGVSFDKGCYVGQEITSRMHWRGGIKKKLYRVSLSSKPDHLPCKIHTTAAVGELRSAAIDHEDNCIGIALLPIETVATRANLQLENGATIQVIEPCHA
ncbi:tRNA-modifying protein YgfZ [Mariprofundus erugo]|uniref:tRNA-modifying protein YgfZ n=1 Tax=Mariprofundus erugo TaxID=2528639 RepID=A0A5R9H2C8_9PROT|nr:folate-binding protein YgfZ [Mariprofundus erugo]TLS68944.1 tRNA-modifying protein YgfZ [Mariprofundus erugo]TLS75238.1 tRNA-modifying protein YgfZ [Mariprofundus erugo]